MLFLLLAIGCAKSAPEPTEPVLTAPPTMTQVEHEDDETVELPDVPKQEPETEVIIDIPETSLEDPEVLTPIGTRVEGTEQEAVEETVTEGVTEISLLLNKTMDMSEITISSGTTLAWKNHDSWPHQLAVETGKSFDTIRHAESNRLLEGGVWEYTFNEKGDFLVRDIFSGPMRMTVTVD